LVAFWKKRVQSYGIFPDYANISVKN
jgi:hypothetical protein